MSRYKVIQDIEAEDKLIGPLSFRQFVYFLIACFLGYLSFMAATRGLGLLLLATLPPMAFCLFFAFPWTPDQPTEVWALARIRFLFKPRKRIWNQSGVKELVTVTVPKKVERNYTDGLSQTEVRSRLQALADTIDSRGWVVKNAYSQPAIVQPVSSDRLMDFSAMPQEVPSDDIRPSDDILDQAYNPTAHHMSQLVSASEKARRENLLKKLETLREEEHQREAQAVPGWFMDQQQTPAAPQPVVSPVPVQTMPPEQPAASAAPAQQQPQVASQQDPVILDLARNNDRDIASLSREANRSHKQNDADDEVVISLR